MKKILLVSFMSVFVLSGCNTFKGLGQDISHAGNEVSQTAEDVGDKI